MKTTNGKLFLSLNIAICISLINLNCAKGQAGEADDTVSTYIGAPPGSHPGGDTDGQGNNARVSWSHEMASDGTNLYIADTGNNKIRKVVINTGVVSTFAGPIQGTGSSGDTDGTGSAARFSWPWGITTDGTNLFVSDRMGHKIRKIVLSTGAVSTLAGPAQGSTTSGDADGTGNAARFYLPSAITNDGTNIYVAECGNNKIRKIVISTGVVTTLAGPAPGTTTSGDTDGTGNAARFNCPYGITIDGGNLYVGDIANNKIRKVTISSGIVTTIAGPPQGDTSQGDTDSTGTSARFKSAAGVFAESSNLYIADCGNNKIRKMNIGTSVVTSLAGPFAGNTGSGDTDGAAVESRFRTPCTVFSTGGFVYVGDSDNNKIRRIKN